MTGQPLMIMLKCKHLYKIKHKGQMLFTHIAWKVCAINSLLTLNSLATVAWLHHDSVGWWLLTSWYSIIVSLGAGTLVHWHILMYSKLEVDETYKNGKRDTFYKMHCHFEHTQSNNAILNVTVFCQKVIISLTRSHKFYALPLAIT